MPYFTEVTPRFTKRQDRKPKLFCSKCQKSQRMAFTREGYYCPKCRSVRAYKQRPFEGVVDTSRTRERGA